MRYFLLFFAFAAFLIQAKGQAPDTLSYPEVGKPMPDLVIKNIAYYPQKKATIRDFRGKWLLLDFWDIHCGACVRSFPRMNRIQQAFSDRLQVMMVGVQDPENQIQTLFAKYREKLHLAIPCAFDSAIADRLDLGYMPHTIVIDDKGIVRSIVSAIDTGQVREFLDGKSPVLRQTYRRMKDYDTMVNRSIPFDHNKPFLVGGNGDNDSAFMYRSVLSIWNPGFHRFFDPWGFGEAVKTGRFQILGVTLDYLYNYAYFGAQYWEFQDSLLYGKCFNRPVLEMKKSTLPDLARQYCYSLIRPAVNNSAKIMQEAMQRDLENFFGLRAGIEVRKCPYWKLIAQPRAKEKLHTKGGKSFAHELSPRVGWTVGNCPIADVMNYIRGNDPGRDRSTNVYLDETGITGNIDITLDCIMNDLTDLRKALQANGLDLVKGEKEMKVVVIWDGSDH
jgi:thiol-disulfide isomerase/thioredoxin